MSEWISVDDKYPEMGRVVLVWGCDENPITAYRVSSVALPGFLWNDYQDLNCVNITGITHWMPLPEPPNVRASDTNQPALFEGQDQ